MGNYKLDRNCFIFVAVHLCICLCVCVHVCLGAGAHVYMQVIGQSQVSIMPQILGTFWTRVSHWIWNLSSRLKWQSYNARATPFSSSPVLGIYRCAPSNLIFFHMVSEDSTQVLMLSRHIVYWLSHLPRVSVLFNWLPWGDTGNIIPAGLTLSLYSQLQHCFWDLEPRVQYYKFPHWMSPAMLNSIEHSKWTKGFYILLTLSSVCVWGFLLHFPIGY